MGETVDSDFRPRECTKNDDELVDRISQLSDDILVHILSFLTLEDAARTSALSKRWIDLWMFVTRLDFDTKKLWDGLQGLNSDSKYATRRKIKCPEYVKWVNKVLQSHKAMILDEFRICFDLGKSFQDDIDKWIEYALARKVQRLYLDLSEYGSIVRGVEAYYAFSHNLLGLGNGYSSASSLPGYCGNGIICQASVGCKTLRYMTFKNVNVAGEVLESLLYNCCFLEYLVVVSSPYLNKFDVCGPNLVLKHLEIMYCTKLHLTVCNTNISSLKISGGRMMLKNVPMLVDVYLGGPRFKYIIPDSISLLSCCLSKLEFLTLQVLDGHVKLAEESDVALPQLTKLKQLTLVVFASSDDSLIAFTSLVRASSNLKKFVLKLEWLRDIKRSGRESKKALAFPHEHLKVVELCGYYGRTTEVELVEYLLENAVALERIIVDPRTVMPWFCPRGMERKQERIARSLARKQLEGLVPSGVELVIV